MTSSVICVIEYVCSVFDCGGCDIVMGESGDGLCREILCCLPKLLIVMRVELLKEKLLTILQHCCYPVFFNFLLLVKLVRLTSLRTLRR